MKLSKKRKSLCKRIAVGYATIVCTNLYFLAISIAYGGGWKPILTCLPVYLVIFVIMTYHLRKEWIALNVEESSSEGEPDKIEKISGLS